MDKIFKIDISKLELDRNNPRLSEFGINEKSSTKEIIEILWDEMAVDELMYSIVSNGFWEYEPLTILEIDDSDKYIVLEGNRRLVAVLLIHNPKLIDKKLPKNIIDLIQKDKNILKQTQELPVTIVKQRKEAWRFIGFKHVNGPARWGSYAKARYIADIHNNYDIPLEDIAFQIGDTHKTVNKLYQGLMVLEQAKRVKVYDYTNDIQGSRIYFSHLYTGLQREGIRDFLKIKDSEDQDKNPVPKDRYKELGELLEWLYGSKKNKTQSIIKSQNPDLKYLDEVLKNREALTSLRRGESLSYSYELSISPDILLSENILSAKSSLQKARAYLSSGYDGEEELLRTAGTVAKIADDLYNEMFRVYNETNSRPEKTRLTE